MAALKLLVVEDDTASLELMAELLQQFRAEVRPISNSQEAPGLIQRERFDGIFLDLKMPILSGFELAKLVRESACNKATPLVIVTGRDEQDTMHLSFSLGATYFLQKPSIRRNWPYYLKRSRTPHLKTAAAVRVFP